MIISFLATLAGALVTGAQALLIHFQGEGVCLNEGCEIVDSLTRVDPLYFNVFGFCFFLFASLGINRARKGSELWGRFVSILLLAALAAEAVLFSFQLFVTDAFCSYCLIILALVVIANLFMGVKQVFKGLVIFAAVVLASASLNYKADSTNGALSLQDGSIGSLVPPSPAAELYFFFSADCRYCEEVLEVMAEDNRCTIHFNPVERVDTFSFRGASRLPDYNPEVNRDYLGGLGITGIPVLQMEREGTVTIVRGATGIKDVLNRYCGPEKTEELVQIPEQSSSEPPFPFLSTEDGCLPEEACEDEIGTSYNQQ